MNRLSRMDTSDLIIRHSKIKDRIGNMAVQFISESEIVLDKYNEEMTALKLTLDVLQRELDLRSTVARFTS